MQLELTHWFQLIASSSIFFFFIIVNAIQNLIKTIEWIDIKISVIEFLLNINVKRFKNFHLFLYLHFMNIVNSIRHLIMYNTVFSKLKYCNVWNDTLQYCGNLWGWLLSHRKTSWIATTVCRAKAPILSYCMYAVCHIPLSRLIIHLLLSRVPPFQLDDTKDDWSFAMQLCVVWRSSHPQHVINALSTFLHHPIICQQGCQRS